MLAPWRGNNLKKHRNHDTEQNSLLAITKRVCSYSRSIHKETRYDDSFFYVALFLVSSQSFAKEQYVFCANQEGTKWEWLPNNRTIDGHWIYTEVKSETYFVTFRIKKNNMKA